MLGQLEQMIIPERKLLKNSYEHTIFLDKTFCKEIV